MPAIDPHRRDTAQVKSPEAFRTISEVAVDLDVPQHVLRFWESKFAQIKPLKRAGGRRYYRPDDIDLLRGIRELLYGDGYTIKGVQKLIRDQGARHIIRVGRKLPPGGEAGEGASAPPPRAAGGHPVASAPQGPAPDRPEPEATPVSSGPPPQEIAASPAPAEPPAPGVAISSEQRARLEVVLGDLLDLKARLEQRRRDRASTAA